MRLHETIMNTGQLHKRYRFFRRARAVLALSACVTGAAGAAWFYLTGDITRAIFWLLVAGFAVARISDDVDGACRLELGSRRRVPFDREPVEHRETRVRTATARHSTSPLFDTRAESTTSVDAAAQF